MKKHIYFVPGTAATSKIFERIELPKDQFELHFLEWSIPDSKNENLHNYVKSLCAQIKHDKPSLVGVSFGGIIVQEMAKIIDYDKLIVVSSIKNKYELPKKLRLIKKALLFRLAPVYFITFIENIISLLYGISAQKKIDAYKTYLSQRDPIYLKWAIKQALYWDQEKTIPGIIHIHGDKDIIFPIENISACITIKNGSHIMIMTKAKQISKIIFDKF